MALAVEIGGFGICQAPSPHSIFVVCVQQESYQAWTVYRKFSSFPALSEQVQTLYPGTVQIPKIDGELLNIDNLDTCRAVLDRWLKTIISNPMILRTQSMYQVILE